MHLKLLSLLPVFSLSGGCVRVNSNYGHIQWIRIVEMDVVDIFWLYGRVCACKAKVKLSQTRRVPFESHWTQTCLIDIFLTK